MKIKALGLIGLEKTKTIAGTHLFDTCRCQLFRCENFSELAFADNQVIKLLNEITSL